MRHGTGAVLGETVTKTDRTLTNAVVRYGRTVTCAVAIVLSSDVHALTLGEPQMLSYLSEPLQVHVPVTEAAGYPRPEQFRLRLLPDQAYAAYGLSAPNNRPDDLRVRWRRENDADPYVVIETQRPITEPILTLLLELRNNKQVLVRKIDLLLDLPTNAQYASAPSARPQQRMIATPTVRRVAQYYGPVRAGESLSRIAQQVRPDSSIPLAQMAGALMQANPHAFFGDAHALKAGVTLRIPSLTDIRTSARVDNLLSDSPAAPHRAPRVADTGPPPFLPRARYTRGKLWALTMEFPSYEAIRPIDLTPKLKALEAQEPVLFKADWTLGSSRPATRNSRPDIEPPKPAPVQPEVTQAAPTVEQTPAEPAAAPATAVADAHVAAPNELSERPEQTSAQPPVTQATAQQEQAATNPQQAAPAPANGVSDAPAPSKSSWWLWLLAALAAAAIWLWRRQRNSDQAAPRGQAQRARPAVHALSTASAETPSKEQLRTSARIRKQLASALQSADPDIQRQAQVAQAQLERGRIEQAERIAAELADSAPKHSVVAKSTDADTTVAKTPYNPPLNPADSQPSEFEQRRLRDKINKLRRKSLPSDSQRQLKVAEAFFERGNLAQANTILSGLKSSSDD